MSASSLSRMLALGAGIGDIALFQLGPGFSSHRYFAMLPLALLAGYAASRLNRVGVLWGIFGGVLFGVPYLLLVILPAGDMVRTRDSLSSRLPAGWVASSALALFLVVWFSSTDPALWSEARRSNTVSGYETYLAERAGGQHVAEARAALARLRPTKDRLDALVSQVRESLAQNDSFAVGSRAEGAFGPKYFVVSLEGPEVDLTGVRFDFVDAIESARTIVLVRTQNREIFKYSDGTPGYHTDLAIYLVDSENTDRRRVMKAWMESPPRVVGGNPQVRDYGIDGVDNKEGEPLSGSLFARLFEKAVR